MSFLRIPLAISPQGTFERTTNEEDMLAPRIRIFLLAGMGEFLRLPSPAVRRLWLELYTMGAGTKFSVVIPKQERDRLEQLLLSELNVWLDGTAEVSMVKLLGGEAEPNGVYFETSRRVYIFSFEYIAPGAPRPALAVGPWNLTENSYARGQ